jgi:hypothetical protein
VRRDPYRSVLRLAFEEGQQTTLRARVQSQAGLVDKEIGLGLTHCVKQHPDHVSQAIPAFVEGALRRPSLDHMQDRLPALTKGLESQFRDLCERLGNPAESLSLLPDIASFEVPEHGRPEAQVLEGTRSLR